MSKRASRNVDGRSKKALSVLLAGLLVCACDPVTPAGHHPRADVKHHGIVVQEYRERHGDAFWYWYIYATTLNAGSASSPSRPVEYYYRSATPVTNFSSVPFTKVQGSLPKEVAREIEESERMPDEKLDEHEEPAEIAEDEAQAVLDSPTEATTPNESPEASPTSSESSDAGSTDSGSNDSGGGGSD